MDVILTHEQADFDAIAAALGAHLMNEKAHPVAPRRMNRNVKAFLTLYGAELPFIDARDLPAENIETITLVDTQSLITLKGMTRRTAVQVVDHHNLRPELPETWSVSVEPVGACTTLFVEGLREHNGLLSSIHATLLLLGIYEDTGSLTYTNTTPRDIRAAAYLLEQGASLQILSRYLNPPLSDEQRQVYDRLLSTTERFQIHGQNILVASANAEDMEDEISTIAHKIRDLLDPDALFLLVRTGDGIRLVARSTTDRINVSKVAEQFGGGGHGRAAAALVRLTTVTNERGKTEKTPSLEAIHDQLVQMLPEHVQPAITVKRIMSPHPRVLSPDTSAEQAAQLMRRYGYEGYPVVDHNQVIGLLTRRAVDHALSHKLNLKASSLMESGEVTVQPHDSIEDLHQLMITSGWGQIPVVDPESKKIIGIVTRTDLLKTMSEPLPNIDRQNLASRLEKALSPARFALLRAVAGQAYDLHFAVYIVGGFVRDLILGRPSPDFDVVVEGDATALASALSKRYGGKLLTHNRFGTAKWTITEIRQNLTHVLGNSSDSFDPADLPDSLDLISARTEFYDYPTALPTVERSSIKLDLHRRDFTINTMALRLDGRHYGELYDYWGGMRDLRRGWVRVLHSLSFVDDPTRMMRAVRFEQRFGFQIEERTVQLIEEARELVRQVSGDRLRHEIQLILQEEKALAMLARLQELDLFSAIHPALRWSPDFQPAVQQALFQSIRPEWTEPLKNGPVEKSRLPDKIGNFPLRLGIALLVWLMNFDDEEGLAISRELRMPNDFQESLSAARKLQADLQHPLPAAVSQITARFDAAPLSALYAVYLSTQDPEIRRVIQQYVQEWRKIWPLITGSDLIHMGIQPGPPYREILQTLRNLRLDGTLHSLEDEKHWLHEYLKALPAEQSIPPS